jgi:hypothetical protein
MTPEAGTIPGTVDALNALPIGSILCSGNHMRLAPADLGSNWRKIHGNKWALYKGDKPSAVGNTVSPDDTANMQNLSHWHIYKVGVFLIREEDDLA